MKSKETLVSILSLILIGGAVMANAQGKPPLMSSSLNAMYNPQTNKAALAVETAKKVKGFLTAGKIWTMTGPRGEVEIKAAILYEGTAVAVLHFSPIDGSLLPLGFHPIVNKISVNIRNIEKTLPSIIKSLKVLDGAEYREPESTWVVPLAYEGMIVAHLKIFVDGIHIVPDYPANREMQLVR